MLHPYQVKLNLGGKPDLPPKPNRHLVEVIEEDEPSDNSENPDQDANEKNNGSGMFVHQQLWYRVLWSNASEDEDC